MLEPDCLEALEKPAAGPRVGAVRGLFVALGLAAWFLTQSLLGARAPNSSHDKMQTAGLVLTQGDGLLALTAPWHRYLTERRELAHALLISSSAAIDVLGVFLLAWSVFGASLRPFVGLLLLFGLRQICQTFSALPAPEGMIWEDPGFPSLLVTYGVANDFFFSGHTAIAVFGAIELGRFGGRKLRVAALFLAVFLAGAVIVLRAHYSMDVFAGAVTALLVAIAADWLAPPADALVNRLAGVSRT